MKYKDMVECMDKECRTIVVAKHVDGLSCCRCGGPTRPMPFMPMKKQDGQCKTKELTIQVNVDNKEALKGIKEVTDAVNECVAALEKLETVMNRFNGNSEMNGITVEVPIVLNGNTIASDVIKRINDSEEKIRI
ncbi:hypothetical protein P4446_01605 [Bacillus tropicus]|uniref:hypothetical protein n=1 Tax=Bacillus tropicus TaxID=2026188 RepID=UPI0009369FBC|nr:hypothetical protein [Bacillus tropicus]MED3377877.1 hypothetical protein [Bacillus tropicus]